MNKRLLILVCITHASPSAHSWSLWRTHNTSMRLDPTEDSSGSRRVKEERPHPWVWHALKPSSNPGSKGANHFATSLLYL